MKWKYTLSKPLLDERDKKAVADCLDSGWLSMGPKTQAFEQRFEEIVDAKHAIAVANGTAALHLALVALGVGMGAANPNFKLENPIELAMSLGGFAYMALSLLYVGFMMFMMARPMHGFLLRIMFGVHDPKPLLVAVAPMLAALGVSAFLSIVPIELARIQAAKRQLV